MSIIHHIMRNLRCGGNRTNVQVSTQMLFLRPGRYERGHLLKHLYPPSHLDLAPTVVSRSTHTQTRQATQNREVVAMNQLLATPTTTSSQFAPVYRTNLARTIGVLQQLQVLCADDNTSLADVIRAVRAMQHEFGENAQLENVIQALVGQHISQQLTARRRQRHNEAVEVLR